MTAVQAHSRRKPPNAIPLLDAEDERRFWEKVRTTPDCWLWKGAIKTVRRRRSHGSFWIGGVSYHAHRVAYELLVGPIPEGLVIDHLCRVPACVNPAHLEPVTNRENVLRGVGCAATNARKTHCPVGHPLSGDNLCEDPHAWRRCRTCERERARRRREVAR